MRGMREFYTTDTPGEEAITSASGTSYPLSSSTTDANESLSNSSVVKANQTVAPKRRLNQKSLTSSSTKQPKAENNFDKQGSESAKDVNVSDVTTTEEETV